MARNSSYIICEFIYENNEYMSFFTEIVQTTTTEPLPTTPPPEPDFTPLIVVVGLAATLAFFFWCFWRPGYLIWRLGRLRNHPCVRACGACIPCSVMCVRCCSCSSCCIGENRCTCNSQEYRHRNKHNLS